MQYIQHFAIPATVKYRVIFVKWCKSSKICLRISLLTIFLNLTRTLRHAILYTYPVIWLDYFINRQPQIAQLRSGDTLYVRGDECLDGNGQSVLKFSRNFMSEHYERLHRQGYELKRAMVNFIVYWQSEKVAKEIKIILPELFFERKKIS